jgi:microcystin-dependent protein
MSDQFVAEIRIFPFNFPPTGWAFCDGQLLPISQNTALFSLLGTVYGGDGKSTFALPNLQGATPLQPGQGQGLTERFLGEESGVDSITLLVTEIPVHTHNVMAAGGRNVANNFLPAPTTVLAPSFNAQGYSTTASANATMAFQALSPAGGSLPHNNLQPYLTLNFCIALQGIFPPRP